MAQVVLGGIGAAVGGGVGQAIGAALGGMVDRGLVASLSPARQRGPRLESLKIQSSADGAPMACVFGRARVTGQVIWAARFLESRTTRSGAGGPGHVSASAVPIRPLKWPRARLRRRARRPGSSPP